MFKHTQRFFILSLMGCGITYATNNVADWQLGRDPMNPNIGSWSISCAGVEECMPGLLSGELDINSTLATLNTDAIINLKDKLISEKELWESGKEETGFLPYKDAPSATIIKTGMIVSFITAYMAVLSSAIFKQYAMASQSIAGSIFESDENKNLSKEFINQLKNALTIVANRNHSYALKGLTIAGVSAIIGGALLKWHGSKKEVAIQARLKHINTLIASIDAFNSPNTETAPV